MRDLITLILQVLTCSMRDLFLNLQKDASLFVLLEKINGYCSCDEMSGPFSALLSMNLYKRQINLPHSTVDTWPYIVLIFAAERHVGRCVRMLVET